MNKDIEKIIEDLEFVEGVFDYILTPDDSELLLGYIKQLQNNNDELKNYIKERIENANRLLNDPNENWDEDANGYVLARKFQLEEILSKINEMGE